MIKEKLLKLNEETRLENFDDISLTNLTVKTKKKTPSTSKRTSKKEEFFNSSTSKFSSGMGGIS